MGKTDNDRIVRYVGELSLLKVLYIKNLITEFEYNLLEKRLKEDYKINYLEIT